MFVLSEQELRQLDQLPSSATGFLDEEVAVWRSPTGKLHVSPSCHTVRNASQVPAPLRQVTLESMCASCARRAMRPDLDDRTRGLFRVARQAKDLASQIMAAYSTLRNGDVRVLPNKESDLTSEIRLAESGDLPSDIDGVLAVAKSVHNRLRAVLEKLWVQNVDDVAFATAVQLSSPWPDGVDVRDGQEYREVVQLHQLWKLVNANPEVLRDTASHAMFDRYAHRVQRWCEVAQRSKQALAMGTPTKVEVHALGMYDHSALSGVNVPYALKGDVVVPALQPLERVLRDTEWTLPGVLASVLAHERWGQVQLV